jgi:hypothetical protein
MKKLWWVAPFAALLVTALAGCPTKQEACMSSCTGCCDSITGECHGGTEQLFCGTGGAYCMACTHGPCRDQACVFIVPGGTGGSGGPVGGGMGGGTDAGSDSGTDAGTSNDAGTYPDGGSPYRYWDGGACTTATDCPCFSSDDCGPGFYCHSQDSSGANVFCVPGARGTGGPGDSCSGEADCASALCTDSASSGMKCSALCDIAAECPASLPRCIYIGFGVDRSICSPP